MTSWHQAGGRKCWSSCRNRAFSVWEPDVPWRRTKAKATGLRETSHWAMRRTMRKPTTDGWYRLRRVLWATGGLEPRVPLRVRSPTRDRRPSAGGAKACKAWSANHHRKVFVHQELAHHKRREG